MKLFFILFFWSSCFFVFSQETDEKFHRAKINYNNSNNFKLLQEAGLPLDHGSHKPGHFIISDFSDTEIKAARALGLKVEIEIEDVQEFYRKQNTPESAVIKSQNATCSNSNSFYQTPLNYNNGSMGGFLTYAEMLQELDDMHTLYPNLISPRTSVGSFLTEEGRSLQWVKITNNPQATNNRQQVLYTAIHHAREPASLSQTIFFMWYLLENYSTDGEIQNILDNTELYFIPVVNPDGYIKNETSNPNGGGMWRKNRRNHGNGTYGVDNNRNYDYWVNGDPNQSVWNTTGTSNNTFSDVYAGTGPFSEPENQAIRYFVESHNFKVALNAHSYGNLLLYPYGYANNVPTPDDGIYNGISEIMVSESGYQNIISSDLYPASGDSDDFMYGHTLNHSKIFAFTPEIGPQFWPAENDIIGICKDMLFTNITAAKLTSNYATVKDISTLYTGATAVFDSNFELTRYGLTGNGNFTVSVIPVSSNISSVGAPVQFSNLTTLQTVTGAIPIGLSAGVAAGDAVVYELNVNNGSYNEKVLITRTFGGSVTLLEDNGNNVSTNFTNNGWAVSIQSYVSPSSSITDSPNGNYGDNELKTITLSNPIDLIGLSGAFASFYAKWDIENDWDFVQFEISLDNGNSWIPQCGKFTNPGSINNSQPTGEPLYDGTQTDWVLEEIDLSEYLGQQILARFEFKSDGAVSSDGFYFDDFKIIALDNTILSESDNSISLFGMYPNPVTDQLYIQTNLSDYSLKIYTLQGQLLLEKRMNKNTHSVDLASLSSGMYFLILESENIQETKKLLKK